MEGWGRRSNDLDISGEKDGEKWTLFSEMISCLSGVLEIPNGMFVGGFVAGGVAVGVPPDWPVKQ